MKVCHIWSDYSPGLFDQSHALCEERSVESHILSARLIDNNLAPPEHFHSIRKVDPKYFSRTDLFAKLKTKVESKIANLKFNAFVQEWISALKPQLLHFHFGHTAIQLRRFIDKQDIPFIISFYGVDISSELKNARSMAAYRHLLQRCQRAIVLCSEAQARVKALGCEDKRVVTWNIPIELQSYPFRARTYDGSVRFLMAARFVEKKGHKYAIEAFTKLAAARPNVYLTLYGYGPSEWLEKLIDQHGIRDRCKLINNHLGSNFKEEYYALLNSHEIFLAPSVVAVNGDDEGGPALTMIAAQSAGLPVIGTLFPGAEISLWEGKTGLVCEAKSGESLFQKMNSICDNIHQWTEMGKTASHLVNLEFSPRRQGDKLIEIYREAIR